MKKTFQLIPFFLNPYVIAFILTLGILWLLPDYFSKYQLVEENVYNQNYEGTSYFYEDIDNDGLSEHVTVRNNSLGNAAYELYKSNGDFVDQFNLDTPLGLYKDVYFQDTNSNNIKELFFVTHHNDSIFLHIHEHLNWKQPSKKKLFVDYLNPYNKDYILRAGAPKGLGKNENFENDFIFNSSTGFGGNPRSIYRYVSKTNTIQKSPHLTNVGYVNEIIDLDNDGKPEFLVNTVAYGNQLDSVYQNKSDYSTWLTVLDDNLQFLFEPIEFKTTGTITQTNLLVNNTTFIYALFSSKEQQEVPSELLKINHKGEIVKSVKVSTSRADKMWRYNQNHLIHFNSEEGQFKLYNPDLHLTNVFNLKLVNSYPIYYDLNRDGRKDWVVFSSPENKIYVFENDFLNPVSLEIKGEKTNMSNFGARYTPKKDQIYFQKGSILHLITYQRNPIYYYKYLFYILVYLGILALTFLISKGQQLRDEKKRAIEREIAELQLKTIKNKVDPHFLFNAMNTISEMTLSDNKIEADRFISRYATFMRQTLSHSDQISTTLKEEMEYVENYIQLQQLRFQHRFDYRIDVQKGIDKQFKLPKHVVFTYVENAIKHGLQQVEKGCLRITVKKEKDGICLQITDNGGGIHNGTHKGKGTGNGLKIMNEIFRLYQSRYKTKIEQSIEEVTHKDNTKGTQIIIRFIPKKE